MGHGGYEFLRLLRHLGGIKLKSRFPTKQVVESGIFLALGYVLSIMKITTNVNGGSVTIVSMLPIIILGYKYGPSWGLMCGFLHGCLQVVEDGGFSPPTSTLISYALVFLLDYALAWAAVGWIAGLCRNISSKTQISVAAGAFLGIAGRYLCSFLSGIIIWRIYAPEGQSVIIYSLVANGSSLIPEMILTTAAAFLVFSIPAMKRQLEA